MRSSSFLASLHRALVAVLVMLVVAAPAGCGRTELESGTPPSATGDGSVVVADGSVRADGGDGAIGIDGISLGDGAIGPDAADDVNVDGADATDPVVSLSVTPAAAAVGVMGAAQFTAIATRSSGATQDVTVLAAWLSSSPTVATVATSGAMAGLATGLSPGVAMITATYMGVGANATLTVSQARLVSIAIVPMDPTIPPGATLALAVAGRFSDGTTADLTAAARWMSSSPRNVGIDATGHAMGRAPGRSAITATVSGLSATTTVTVPAVFPRSITIAPATSTLAPGAMEQLRATATYSDGSTGDVTAIVNWRSSDPTVAAVSNMPGARGTVTGGRAGTATISAGVPGLMGSATVTVTSAMLVSIDVMPAMATLAAGGRQALRATAHYSDGSTSDVTSTAVWASSNPAVATVSNAAGSAGRVSAVGPGTAMITATAGGVTGTATITVAGVATLVSLAITPPAAVVPRGGTARFALTGTYSDGTTADLTATAAWMSSDVTIADVAGGLVTARGAGTATITATVGSTSATARVVVPLARVVSVAVSPAMATIGVSGSARFRATATLDDGTTQDVTATAVWTSSNSAVATVDGTGTATGVSSGTATINAAFAGATGSATLTVTAATLTGITITPVNPTLAPGASATFTATGTFSDGTTADVSASAVWASSAPAVLAIGPMGAARALTPGTAIVSATIGGVTANTTATVTAARLTAIVVAPAASTLSPGATVALRATGTFSDGTMADVTTAVTWSSSDGTIAAVSNAAGTQGVATALAPGMVTVTAAQGGVRGTAAITVSAATLTALSVTPTAVTTPAGTMQQFTATGTFSDGTRRDVTAQVAWSSSAPAVATVSNAAGSQGLATAVAAGTATITATLGGVTGSATLTVTAPALVSITVQPAMGTVAAGATLQFTARGTYADGSTAELTTQVTWSTDSAAIAAISNAAGSQGQATGVSAGTTGVHATLGMLRGDATLTVTSAALVSITVTPIGASTPTGTAVQFTAEGIYSDGTSRNLTGMVTWASSMPGVATISRFGRAMALTGGTTAITATLGGIMGGTTLTVTTGTLVALQITPITPTLHVGDVQQFVVEGIYSDGTSRNLTGLATWTSSNPGVLGVSDTPGSRGRATALSGGTAVVSAVYGGLMASTTVTVTSATLVSITIAPALASQPVSAFQQFTAAAIYSDGTSQPITGLATWTSSDPTVAQVSDTPGSRGLARGLTAGTVTIRAQYMGVSGAAQFTVTSATITTLVVTPAVATVNVGMTTGFTVAAVYSDGTSRDVTGLATWTSSDVTIAQVSDSPGSKGRATGIAGGTATITAQFSGMSGTARLTVSTATVTSVVIAPAVASVNVGEARQFTAAAIFSDGTSRDVTGAATWLSSNAAVASVGDSGGMKGRALGISGGTVTLTASFAGVTGRATLRVNTATVVSITVFPAAAVLPAGSTAQLTAAAIYSDGSSRDITGLATWTSSDGTIASVGDSGGMKGRVIAIAAGAVSIHAQYGGVTGTAMVTVTSARLTMVEVTPFNPTSPVGVLRQFRATAFFDDGTSRDVTGLATWTSSDPTVAAVSDTPGSKGVAQTLSNGTTTIAANYMGTAGSTTFTVNSAALVRIQVTPFAPRVPASFPIAFTATAIYSDGTTADVTQFATWTSSAPAVAQVSDAFPNKGVAQTFMPGTANITAFFRGVSAAATLTVTSATLSSIAVTPNTAAIPAGGSQQFTATGTFSDGTTLPLTNFVTWLSSAPMTADVSNAPGSRGNATGFMPGTVTVTAQRGSVTGTATLTVR